MFRTIPYTTVICNLIKTKTSRYVLFKDSGAKVELDWFPKMMMIPAGIYGMILI